MKDYDRYYARFDKKAGIPIPTKWFAKALIRNGVGSPLCEAIAQNDGPALGRALDSAAEVRRTKLPPGQPVDLKRVGRSNGAARQRESPLDAMARSMDIMPPGCSEFTAQLHRHAVQTRARVNAAQPDENTVARKYLRDMRALHGQQARFTGTEFLNDGDGRGRDAGAQTDREAIEAHARFCGGAL